MEGGSAHVVGGCGVPVASCPGGLDHNFQRVLGSSPRSALYKTCSNKKIGKNMKGAEDHPEVRRPSRREKDAENPAAHLKEDQSRV